MMASSFFCCYVLRSETTRKTYAGYTVDPGHRIRQHNGELKGGAWATSSGGKGGWSFAFVVHSPELDKHAALSLEWHLKHLKGGRPTRRSKQYPPEKLRGLPLRLACLRHAFGLPKFRDLLPSLVVYAAPDLMNDVFAAVADATDHPCCVVSLDDLPAKK